MTGMLKSRSTKEQMEAVLRETDGKTVAAVAKRLGFRKQAFYT
jgi:hypothetical protein